MATPYQVGYAFEREAVKFLRGLNYFVIRSAGSKGPVDIVAWNEDEAYLLQLKVDKPTGPELEAIKEGLRAVVWPGERKMITSNPEWVESNTNDVTLAWVEYPAVRVHREVWVKIRGGGWNRHEA
jgi:hypothetical protein